MAQERGHSFPTGESWSQELEVRRWCWHAGPGNGSRGGAASWLPTMGVFYLKAQLSRLREMR